MEQIQKLSLENNISLENLSFNYYRFLPKMVLLNIDFLLL